MLFILSEDQGAHLSLLGTAGLQTPNIDANAKSDVYFDNAFVAYPVCSASKAAFYTGLHSHTNGILNHTHNFHKPADKVTDAERNQRLAKINRIRDPSLTMTEILHANGYMFKKRGNRTYRETLRVKDQFPLQYRILAEQDPQQLGGRVPAFELYDLDADPDEVNNLVENGQHCEIRERLLNAIRKWSKATADPAMTFTSLDALNLWIKG